MYTMLEDDERIRALNRHVSHIRKGRRALIRHVAYFPNSTKKTINKIFSMGLFLHQQDA
jgi:hypothetical protein